MQIVLYTVEPFAPTNFERKPEIGALPDTPRQLLCSGFPSVGDTFGLTLSIQPMKRSLGFLPAVDLL